jgi:S1-C subfamily serine protease
MRWRPHHDHSLTTALEARRTLPGSVTAVTLGLDIAMQRSALAAAVAIAFTAGACGARPSTQVEPSPAAQAQVVEANLIGVSTSPAPRGLQIVSYRGAVARVAPSVVTVYSAHVLKSEKASSPKVNVLGLGSGVVVDRDGDVVTNYHVVEDATELAIALADGTVVPCRVIGVDEESDLALLHVEGVALQPIVIADIEDVEPGDVVLAVGNPLGVGQSVTQGIVSAIVRKGARPVENFIQTDAAINPGNSGGALVDTAGRLVGINVLILSHSGGSEGIGFAIPVDLVQSVVASLKTHGRVVRGWLGWAVAAVPSGDGALVVAVDGDGPARRAGIVPGDVVVRVGARRVQRQLDAADVVLGSGPGTRVPVEIMRRGVAATLDVELAPVPAPNNGS